MSRFGTRRVRDVGCEVRCHAVRPVGAGEVRGGDERAVGDEPLGHGCADPSGCTGDEHLATLETAHQKGNTALQAATSPSGSPVGTTSNVTCRS